jgi:hypothetical protein
MAMCRGRRGRINSDVFLVKENGEKSNLLLEGKMKYPKFRQDAHYRITEWDGSRWLVMCRHVGGDVLMQYQDGVVHRVTARYFESLNPSVAAFAPPGPSW